MNTATLNGRHIELRFDYNEVIVAMVKLIADRKWVPEKKMWTLPATPYHAKELLKIRRYFEKIDGAILQLADGKETAAPVPKFPNAFSKLYDYQKEGVKFIAKAEGKCIVADDMGLGKSAEALIYVSAVKKKTLIVSPSNVLYKWRDEECKMWASNMTASIVKTGKSPIENTDIVIMSYSIMVSRYEELVNLGFAIAIFDEAHYLKNSKSQRSRVAKALLKNISMKLFLSGTPFMNRPAELFPLLNMLDPYAFSNFYTFAIRYCGATKEGTFFHIPPNGVSNVAELAERLKRYMIRRTKKEVALELPDLKRVFIPLDYSASKEYKQAVKEFAEWARDQKNRATALTKLTKLRQLIGDAKLQPAIELAEDVLEGDRKVVLFCHHKAIVDKLAKHFHSHGVGVISGDTSAEKRQELAKHFNLDNSKLRVMIITIAGSEGINLFGASDIIFVEREWTPAKEEQSEARLHRIGQKNAVTSYYLVLNGTVDERMNNLIEEKRKIFGQVIGQDEILTSILQNFTE